MFFKITIAVISIIGILLLNCDSSINQSTYPTAGTIYSIGLHDSVLVDESNITIGFEAIIDQSAQGWTVGLSYHDSTYSIINQNAYINNMNGYNFGYNSTFYYAGYLITPADLIDLSQNPGDETLLVEAMPFEVAEGFDGPLAIRKISIDSVYLAEFYLDSASVAGDTLTIKTNYGGGCSEHYFMLIMRSKSMTRGNPAIVDLYLRHYGNTDFCQALVHRQLKFDLSPLKAEFQSMQASSGSIIINVLGYRGRYLENKQVFYTF